MSFIQRIPLYGLYEIRQDCGVPHDSKSCTWLPRFLNHKSNLWLTFL